MRISTTVCACLVAALTISGCGSSPDAPTQSISSANNSNVVAQVLITPASVSPITVGATATLSAAAKNSQGLDLPGATITWSSSNAAVATVASGVVTGLSAGTAQISAASGTISSAITVTVNPATGGVPIAGSETFATLPQSYVNTTMPPAPASGGKIISVNSTAAFTAALSSAQGGDVIELANGVTYTGNFLLPAKPANNTNWIVIRPADQSGLPAEGNRMTPTIAAAANLPRIVSPTNLGAIATVSGAHHWRLVGVEVTSTIDNTGLVRFGDPDPTVQNSLSQVPHDLVVDRSYIHGATNTAARRCVALNSANSAVIDSYLASCVDKGSDAQAVWGSNGPGPFKIVNNYLEGSGETVMFGRR